MGYRKRAVKSFLYASSKGYAGCETNLNLNIDIMKRYISNSDNIYDLITGETNDHYICGNNIYLKSEIITNYHPLDDLRNKLHLHEVPFYCW